jgi:hypothetical protein
LTWAPPSLTRLQNGHGFQLNHASEVYKISTSSINYWMKKLSCLHKTKKVSKNDRSLQGEKIKVRIIKISTGLQCRF